MDKKVFTWTVCGVIMAFAVVLLFLWLRKKLKKDVTSTIEVNEANLTQPKTNYTLYANQLYTAMNGLGTDEETIYRVLGHLQTADDWNQLVKAFGTKKASSWLSGFEGTLYDWLSDELDTKEMKKVNEILAKIDVTI